MVNRAQTVWARYLAAVLCIVAAAAVRSILQQLGYEAFPFVPFLIAMVVAAWYGGFGPGLLTGVLSAVVFAWMGDSRPPPGHPIFGLVVYAVVCMVIAAFGGFMVRARRRIDIQIEELQRQQEELQQAARLKDEFLAVLAHELRNPLAPIASALEILKEPGVDRESAAEARDVASRQLTHLSRLVDDLLDVSRIMRGKVELRKKRVELATIIDRAIETARPLIDGERHELVVSQPEEAVWVEADLVRLSQVLANLLSNAAKYTEPGGRIGLSAAIEEGVVVIRVRDSGIGIAPEALPRLFELFMQVAPGASRSQGGLGIGLTLVKNLVALHAGTVEANSAGLGQGSEFCVRLPGILAEAPESVAEEEPDEAGQRRRILVVDDNADAAQSLAMLLKLRGHEVRVALCGAEALSSARLSLPELVFLDIGMPGMDGYEVARQMRVEFDSSLTLVALTGWGSEQDRLRTRDAGFDQHLTKPVDLAALEAALAAPQLEVSR